MSGQVESRRGKHGSKQGNKVAERKKKEHEVDVTHHDNIVNEIPPNALSIFVQLCLHTTEVCGRGRGNHCTLQLFQIVNVRVGTGDDHAANFGCIAVTWRDSKERWKTPRCERYDQNGLLDTHGGGYSHRSRDRRVYTNTYTFTQTKAYRCICRLSKELTVVDWVCQCCNDGSAVFSLQA